MKAVIISLALVAVSSQAAPPAPGQARDKNRPPTTGTSSISGTVTADESGSAPVRRAIVRVTGASFNDPSTPAVDRVVVTDDKGRYVVPNLPAGRFYLSVDKGGWVRLRYGAQSMFDAGVAVAVAEGQGAVADMKLTRGAVIAGRVVDEHGRPQPGMRPVLLEYRTVSGQQRLTRVSLITQFSSQTNDLGEYRLFAIPPGSYIVAIQPTPGTVPPGMSLRMATDEEIAWARQGGAASPALAAGAGPPPPGQGVVFSPIYHPGATDPSSAATITVGAGEQRMGVDFVTALVPTTQVRGVVVRPDGQPAAGARLTIGRTRGVTSPLETAGASVNADAKGAFTFTSVSTGDFVINARASSQAGSPTAPAQGAGRGQAPVMDLWGTTPLTVSGREVSGITVTMQPGMTVSGRVVFEAGGGTTPPAPTSVRMMIMSASMTEAGMSSQSTGASMMSGSTSADGTFSFQGLAPGRFVVSASGPGINTGTWMQKAVMVAGRNVLESGLELRAGEDVGDVAVVLNDQPAEISGTLLDSAGRPAPEYHVFVFPTDKAAWTQGSQRMRPPVRPASDGRFRTMSLLAGEYYVAALSRFDPASMYDAAFLEQVAAAAFKITLAEGEKKVQDLKIK